MIKIYGEAKTATTYFQRLVELNSDAKFYSSSPKSPGGWKHGFPQPVDADVVFLMRDIYQWVMSYLADGSDARFDSLKGRFGNREGYRNHPHWMPWYHLIDARTFKYKAYIKYLENHGGLLIKTEYLKENPSAVLLLEYYGYKVNNEIKDINSHVYKKDVDGKDDPRRRPLTADERKWIDKVKDPELEAFVDGLQWRRY